MNPRHGERLRWAHIQRCRKPERDGTRPKTRIINGRGFLDTACTTGAQPYAGCGQTGRSGACGTAVRPRGSVHEGRPHVIATAASTHTETA